MNKSKTLSNKILILTLSLFLCASVFLMTACNDGFDNSTKLNVNAPNTKEANQKYTAVTVKANEDVYFCWTIADNAQDTASAYLLVFVDNDKNALTAENALKSVNIYDSNKKALGTATTDTNGKYNLSSVLGDSKISGGTYYAVCQFVKDGTYNANIQLLAK